MGFGPRKEVMGIRRDFEIDASVNEHACGFHDKEGGEK